MRFLSSSSLRFSLVMPCFPKLPWSLVPMNWKPSLIEGFGSNQFREAGNGRVPVKRFSASLQQVARPLHQVETRIRKVRTQNVPRKKGRKPDTGIMQMYGLEAWGPSWRIHMMLSTKPRKSTPKDWGPAYKFCSNSLEFTSIVEAIYCLHKRRMFGRKPR